MAERSNLIVEAEPGSGKTTRLPLALMSQALAAKKKIILLGPRRVTVRAAATRLAEQLGEKPGQRIGYRIRGEAKVSDKSIIEVMTEGLFIRKLVNDPELQDCFAVIFDEIHERSLDGDLGLTLCHDIQQALRPDLRIIAMSATLAGLELSSLLPEAAMLSVPGRSHPLKILWDENDSPFVDVFGVSRKILAIARETTGDILTFLPGEAEIRRCQRDLESNSDRQGVDFVVTPLYGSQSSKDQHRPLRPDPNGARKLILSTNIAESSLTIDGVSVVIDTGLERRPSFDLTLKAMSLATAPISQASADQRAGRAARQGPGVCYRLWSERSHRARERQRPPEIEHSDLSSLALSLVGLGVSTSEELKWLTPPPKPAFDLAMSELEDLGITENKSVTSRGKAVLRLAASPHIASLLLRGKELGMSTEAAAIASVLEDPTLLLDKREIELKHQVNALLSPAMDKSINRGKIAIAKKSLSRYIALISNSFLAISSDNFAPLLARTFPDFIAQARPNQPGSFLLANGSGAEIDPEHPLALASYLAVGNLIKTKNGTIKISLATELQLTDLLELFDNEIHSEDTVEITKGKSEFSAHRTTKFRNLVLKKQPIKTAKPEQLIAALKGISKKSGLVFLPWKRSTEELLSRLHYLHKEAPGDWPDVSKERLSETLEEWLLPYLTSVQKYADLSKLNLDQILLDQLSWDQQNKLTAAAPTSITIPTGEKRRIDYSQAQPTLSCRIQELFGLTESPKIGLHQKPVVIELLSPAQRPVQTTQDLRNFWATTYSQVKAELKGRYPKHFWPDDPLTAQATSLAKPRKK